MGLAAYEVSKRAIDLAGSALLLVALAPVFAAVALAVRATSPGPALFRQRRLGRNGREFWCYKFRTMVVDAEEQLRRRTDLRERFEANFKIKDDPRLTPLGRFLRRTSLDELPQLLNILRGDMSLIGPRPIVPHELAKYGEHGDLLLTVKPGLGGLWQVRGRSDTSYEDRVRLDVEYIRRRRLALDLELILRTAVVVVWGRGAC
jgi:lipopolysaccharide/colanic/teichoic acid biosynthesis glycosyltransferase